MILKLFIQQLPASKKVGCFYNNNQTNLDLQAKPETNLRKQLEKVLVHTGLLQQQPKINPKMPLTRIN
jgi:hypothetical protein